MTLIVKPTPLQERANDWTIHARGEWCEQHPNAICAHDLATFARNELMRAAARSAEIEEAARLVVAAFPADDESYGIGRLRAALKGE